MRAEMPARRAATPMGTGQVVARGAAARVRAVGAASGEWGVVMGWPSLDAWWRGAQAATL
jgi:hypothetical protein